jgi:multiple sugar transport system permease protein
MTTQAADPGVRPPGWVEPAARVWDNPRGPKPSRIALHLFLIVMSLIWLFPFAWAFYSALRPYGDVVTSGNALTPPSRLSFDNFITAWDQTNLAHFFINTLFIAIPAVVLALFLASMVAFAVSRFSFTFNVALLMIFTAGNLLPPQVIIVPLYQIYLLLPLPQILNDQGVLYDSTIGIILINIIFQTGFCAFVLSNYMRTLPKELTEAALVDGASVWRIYRQVILPLCRPALAALATLEFTFIYNDFFWGLLLLKTGDKRPITAALNNFQGAFFTDQNVLAAMSIMVAVPTVVVYIALQKQFIRGLTLGSTKG